MKPRSLILILLIVLLPLALLTWATVRLARGERAVVEQRFRELMEERLRDINGTISRHFEDVARTMHRITEIDDIDVEKLRQLNRSEPRVLQVFLLSDDDRLLYPDPTQPLNASEQNFLFHTAKMFTGQDLREAVLQQEATTESSPLFSNRAAPAAALAEQSRSSTLTVPVPKKSLANDSATLFGSSSGWFVWYWDRGLNLIYWQRRPSGRIVGVALERARWMADLIAELPQTAAFDASSAAGGSTSPGTAFESRIRLTTESTETVYQWGLFEVDDEAAPYCEIPLTAPLSSWRLQCFVPPQQLAVSGRSAYTGLVGGLIAVACALAAMAFVLYRDYARDMNEAAQQVSFVNQVSHELKTPLTNIRLYAELLETDLDAFPAAESERPRGRLNVILSEGQRLSRLIGNVLTFARQKKKSLQPQLRLQIPDELIHQIIDRFQPALDDLGIAVESSLAANQPMPLDSDFLEQILGNLISNIEKYAADGRLLRIQSSQDANSLTIDVKDAGPGIEASKRAEVFRPFSRLSRSVSYAAGTGIGLSIARELARLHGGNIVLVPCHNGCCFRVTLMCRVE